MDRAVLLPTVTATKEKLVKKPAAPNFPKRARYLLYEGSRRRRTVTATKGGFYATGI
jgi:hypothetical protein